MQDRDQFGQWLGLVAACFLACAAAQAATYYVATHGNDSTGAGTSANPWLTISNGVAHATVIGDTVLVSNGTYNLETNVTIAGVSVLGLSGCRDDVIVNGQRLTWGFYLTHQNSLLAHVTVTNGRSTDTKPGGVHVLVGLMSNCVVTDCEAASPNQWYNPGGVHIENQATVTCCLVKNNNRMSANNGGGGVVISPWGSLSRGKLLDSVIIGNSSSNNGGGVALICNGGALVSNCTIINNFAATNGGGMYDRDTNTLIGSIINSNRTDGIGGGIYSSGYTGIGTTMSNCTINHNYAKSDGGGMYCVGSIIRDTIINSNLGGNDQGGGGVRVGSGLVVMERCTISRNTAAGGFGGGGIAIRYGRLRLRDSTVAGNVSTNAISGWAGGIYSNPDAPYPGTVIDRCVINSNIALVGGGVYAYQRTIISNSTIAANTAHASSGAGGIYFNSAGTSQQLWNCVIQGNVANRPGGLYIQGVTPSVYGCLVAGNRSTNSAGWAGGIYVTAGVVENCTIVSNQASGTGDGGGLYCDGGIRVRNTIIYGNATGTAASSNWYNNGSAMFYTNCCTMPTNNLPGTGNLSANPNCVNLAGGNYRLCGNSPCNNAGTNQDWMTNSVDLDSQVRIRYGTVDIGAYETILIP